MSHLGFGEAFGNILTLVLLAGVAFFAIRFLLRRFGPKPRRRVPATCSSRAPVRPCNRFASSPGARRRQRAARAPRRSAREPARGLRCRGASSASPR